jgi:hypothetical protein
MLLKLACLDTSHARPLYVIIAEADIDMLAYCITVNHLLDSRPETEERHCGENIVNQLHLVYVEGATTHSPHARRNGAEKLHEKPSNRFKC